jgi:PAS domain S-box-containing protein
MPLILFLLSTTALACAVFLLLPRVTGNGRPPEPQKPQNCARGGMDLADGNQGASQEEWQCPFCEVLLHMPLIATVLGREGRITFCNDFLLELTGWQRSEILGRDFFELFCPDPDESRRLFENAFDGTPLQCDRIMLTRQGARRIIAVNSTALQGQTGGTTGLAYIGVDVTDARHYANALETVTGDVLAATGAAFFDSLVGYLCRTLPADRAWIGRADAGTVTTLAVSARGGRGENFSYRVEGSPCAILEGGRVLIVESGVRELYPFYDSLAGEALEGFAGVNLCNASGERLGVLVVTSDAPLADTDRVEAMLGIFALRAAAELERTQAEQALVESEEHVRQIFDQSDDGLILFRMGSLEIIDANPAAGAIFGISTDELKKLKPWQLISLAHLCKLMRVLSRGEGPQGFQLERGLCHRPEGSSLEVAIRAKVLTLRDEDVVLCSVRDITEKVKLEDEMRGTQAKLIQANKMTSLGMLVSGIAHEINNPNNFISVNAVMLSDVWRDLEPILREYRERRGDFDLGGLPYSEMEGVVPRLLSGITEGSSRITGILKGMRNFVRKEQGGIAGSIDVNRTIEAAASLLWHHIHRHTDAFTMSLAEELPAARGSWQQIEQVIVNLIMNALQALPGKEYGVRIESGLDGESGLVMITVRDEGHGMGKNVLKHLTEPFFSTKIDKGGTGLGLYISASIIAEHEGTLSFDSAPGKGTTATIRLPVSDGDALTEAAGAAIPVTLMGSANV